MFVTQRTFSVLTQFRTQTQAMVLPTTANLRSSTDLLTVQPNVSNSFVTLFLDGCVKLTVRGSHHSPSKIS